MNLTPKEAAFIDRRRKLARRWPMIGSIPESSLVVMAALLAVAMLSCFFVLVVGLILMFAAMANERRHLEIIERLGSPGAIRRMRPSRSGAPA